MRPRKPGQPHKGWKGSARMSNRMMKDVTQEYERMKAELLLIRVQLGLNPCQDVRWAIEKLHNDGREAFEAARGPKCDWSHEWQPR